MSIDRQKFFSPAETAPRSSPAANPHSYSFSRRGDISAPSLPTPPPASSDAQSLLQVYFPARRWPYKLEYPFESSRQKTPPPASAPSAPSAPAAPSPWPPPRTKAPAPDIYS